MTTDMLDLARRAVACKGWRWMPGMRATRPELSPAGVRVVEGNMPVSSIWLPDLTDPATVGCLLALVREAWEPHRGRNHIACTTHTGSGWGVGAYHGAETFVAIVLPTFDTEAEALVAALEAAP